MSIRKAVAKAIDVLMKKTLKEPVTHVLFVGPIGGLIRVYQWSHGNGQGLMNAVTMDAADPDSPLTWDHAAAINREVRAAESLCKIQF